MAIVHDKFRALMAMARPMSLSETTRALEPWLREMCDKLYISHGPLTADVIPNPVDDTIQLVIKDGSGRRFLHPRFIDRQEIVSGEWFGLVAERFISTADGRPTSGLRGKAEPAFSLSELEQAQELMDSLK